jgi:gas vesicle protein
MKNSGKVFLGFLSGAAAGVLAGILMAPDKGKNTRQNVANKASQFKDDVGVTFQKGVDKINSFKESAFSLINKYGGEESTPGTGNPENFSQN